jgi:pullulanase/glycogen debranching enzyme
MMKIVFNLLVPLLTTAVMGQSVYSAAERLQGYKIQQDRFYFVFDEQIYNLQPYRVMVEGSFRNWDHDLQDSSWYLHKAEQEAGIWILKSPQPIEPNAQFKFRVDSGTWLQPPAGAENQKEANLIFLTEANAVTLKAEIAGPRHIRARITGPDVVVSLNPDDYRLTDAGGREIAAMQIFYCRPGEVQIYPAEDLDVRRVYYVREKRYKADALVTYEGWIKYLYSDKKLGAYYDAPANCTRFRLFAPRAAAVNLYLYKNPGEEYYVRYPLNADRDGVWEVNLSDNLNGIYYDYTIHGPDEPGNNFYEKVPVHITDPYGQVSVDSFGPCRIWPEVLPPPRAVKGGRPAMEDVIAYEVHVQDFTRLLPVAENAQGTFTAFFKRNLKNKSGEKIGFDHLLELGINVVHLQPIQEFLHFPEREWRQSFLNDPFMIEQGINQENYQWGYRTTHFFAIESRYREKGTEWGAQNQQFRDMVEALHDAGIAVIVDVVFNHTGERMDGRMDFFNFSVIDKPYYYRTNNRLDYIGEYGTEVKSEERPMVQRWLYDQCRNLIEQYGVDGFRVDLAGQTDQQTLLTMRRILGADIIIYGEPWISSSDPEFENNPDWDWYKADAPITFFQDESRNAFCGPPLNPEDKWKDRGFAGGSGDRESTKKALSAGFPEDDTPLDGISYLDIHDNWTLADRFAKTGWDARLGVEENRVKIAATLLFTTLGPVVMHGGTEFLRNKSHAPLVELKKKFQNAYLYFHGKRDTYNLAAANVFDWETKGKSAGDDNGAITCNYKNMYDFWRGLIALRKSETGKVFRIKEKPVSGYYRWFEPENTRLLGYMVDEKILVLINADSVRGGFTGIKIPQGRNWRLIATVDRIEPSKGIKGRKESVLKGGSKFNFLLDGDDLRIWVRQN